jgi:type II secretory pathway component GspD/PulD (secretin)
MTLKVPFKAVPNFKQKTSCLAVNMCFGLASSLFALAAPYVHANDANAKEQLKGDGQYIERGNIEVTQAVSSNPMQGSAIVYARTKIKDLESASSTVLPAIVYAKPQTTAMLDSKPAHPSVAAPAEKSELTIKQSVDLKQPEQPVIKGFQTEVMTKPVAKGIQVVAEQTDAEKALIKKIQAKNALAKQVGSKQVALNDKNIAANDAELSLTPTEKLIPTPKSIKQSKAKQNNIEDIVIDKLEFNRANMLDVARALADMSGLNFVATDEAAKKNVTVFLQKISVKNALEAITKNSGVWYRQDKNSNTFRIMSTEEYQRDLVVYREDTTKVFNLFNHNPVLIATAVRDLYGERVQLSYGSDYDDFNTGSFNGGGNQGSQSNQNNRNNRNGASGSPSGASLGGGQNSLRRSITSGSTSTNNARANIGQNNNFDEKKSGTAGNGAITEKFTADQLDRLENAAQVGASGNLIVTDAIKGITGAQQPIYITISSQQNMMIVRTSDAAAVKEIDNLVKAMDKPTAQVLLEMRILEVDVGDAYNQLFSFGAFSKNGKHGARAFPDTDLSGTGKFVYTFVDNLINVRLELLEKTNKAKIVSSPVLLASNNRTARLFVGEERLLIRGATLTDPVLGLNGQVVTPGKITYETEIRNIGNTLNITPKINADGTVTLGLFQDTSSVNPNSVDFPPLIAANGSIFNFSIDTVDTANIEGVVAAKDGLTVAIGGLIRTSVSKNESKVPVLGDLPLVGNLFKDKVESTSRKELILLITPHIISSPAETDEVTRDAIEPLTDQEW